jgi:hypothetical protein
MINKKEIPERVNEIRLVCFVFHAHITGYEVRNDYGGDIKHVASIIREYIVFFITVFELCFFLSRFALSDRLSSPILIHAGGIMRRA